MRYQFPSGEPEWFMDEHGLVKASVEVQFMALSVGVAAVGLIGAYVLYKDGPSKAADLWAKRLGPAVPRSARPSTGVDTIYHYLFVAPLRFIAGACYQVVDQLLVDGLMVGGVSGVTGFFGNLVRIFHNGNVRRYLVWLTAGVAIVLGAVYLNPTISRFGPTPELNKADLGGLRPTLGERPIKLKILGTWEIQLGPNVAPPRPAAAAAAGEGGPRAVQA